MKRILKQGIVVFVLIFAISCSENSTNTNDPNSGLVSNQQILDEINLARTNPNFYISLLEDMKKYFDGNYYKEPGEITQITYEGVGAVNETITALRNYGTRSALILSEGISKGCLDHVNDHGSKGLTGHTGSDGSEPWDRANRYGKWSKSFGENISYGEKTARKIVLQLIIDDGVPSRGHRENIFNSKFTKLGAAFGSHSKWDYMCVIGFAGEYEEKTSSISFSQFSK